jgi:hypothetical protein
MAELREKCASEFPPDARCERRATAPSHGAIAHGLRPHHRGEQRVASRAASPGAGESLVGVGDRRSSRGAGASTFEDPRHTRATARESSLPASSGARGPIAALLVPRRSRSTAAPPTRARRCRRGFRAPAEAPVEPRRQRAAVAPCRAVDSTGRTTTRVPRRACTHPKPPFRRIPGAHDRRRSRKRNTVAGAARTPSPPAPLQPGRGSPTGHER